MELIDGAVSVDSTVDRARQHAANLTGDAPMVPHLLAGLRVARHGPGRPRTRPAAPAR
ncbi:hypothetical protein [Kocuria turfanensis]|uniref:Uncharacterized protein n=1 Tax=Kocuria turfanensis TaxID=388357 RepID=A0A512I9M2_9MICC|nr:hypothetical protein [Kocuria turfanensis]GEO94390.1 hypothetical protein KTU01_05130 [Kocuria turfanensis]